MTTLIPIRFKNGGYWKELLECITNIRSSDMKDKVTLKNDSILSLNQ